jgi:hypothetical protein
MRESLCANTATAGVLARIEMIIARILIFIALFLIICAQILN